MAKTFVFKIRNGSCRRTGFGAIAPDQSKGRPPFKRLLATQRENIGWQQLWVPSVCVYISCDFGAVYGYVCTIQ